jgi:3-methyladenine DNA glycosylase Tag
MAVSFTTIMARAVKRKGGAAKLTALLPAPKTGKAMKSIPDDRWLAEMTRAIFQAGFNWKVVDAMWPGFEAAFEGFQPRRWRMMSDDDLDRLIGDTRVVRYGAKLRSVQRNAEFLTLIASEHGSAGSFFASWPRQDFVGLLDTLKRRGDRLGGQTAQYFLRTMGVDGFILSRDGVAALIDAGVVDKPPTSRRDLAAVQAAYNAWMDESGLPLMQISRILSFSVGPNSPPDQY